jgi:hypothetical protein
VCAQLRRYPEVSWAALEGTERGKQLAENCHDVHQQLGNNRRVVRTTDAGRELARTNHATHNGPDRRDAVRSGDPSDELGQSCPASRQEVDERGVMRKALDYIGSWVFPSPKPASITKADPAHKQKSRPPWR